MLTAPVVIFSLESPALPVLGPSQVLSRSRTRIEGVVEMHMWHAFVLGLGVGRSDNLHGIGHGGNIGDMHGTAFC